jgi:hypothetical protein
MNETDRKTEPPRSSFQRERRNRLLVLIAVAVLGAGATYSAIGSPFASAAPQSVRPSTASAVRTQDSQRWYIADPDADVGPGQCEPCVVNAP